jgi:hypothetical protein
MKSEIFILPVLRIQKTVIPLIVSQAAFISCKSQGALNAYSDIMQRNCKICMVQV